MSCAATPHVRAMSALSSSSNSSVNASRVKSWSRTMNSTLAVGVVGVAEPTLDGRDHPPPPRPCPRPRPRLLPPSGRSGEPTPAFIGANASSDCTTLSKSVVVTRAISSVLFASLSSRWCASATSASRVECAWAWVSSMSLRVVVRESI